MRVQSHCREEGDIGSQRIDIPFAVFDARKGKELIMAGEGKYSQRAIVVTGASSGIGRACALHLDNLGAAVFAGVRREEDGEALKNESGGRIIPLLLDVTDGPSIAAAAERVAGAVGEAGLSGLVNNAGMVVSGPLEFIPPAEMRKQFEVNVLGQIAVTQAFLPLLRRARGRIVNMGSIAGRMALPFIGPYSASKYALEAVTDSLRIELQPWGISVSIIEPGAVATPIWEKSRAAAGKLAHGFPPRARELYGPAMNAQKAAAEKSARAGIAPEIVARAVEHALFATRPRTRYLVGRGVRLRAFLKRVLPDRLLDRLVFRHIGLPERSAS
jgi:NAD(P)-dependent dehydrogenase (short-subunit alcohol dehydrogenase family)